MDKKGRNYGRYAFFILLAGGILFFLWLTLIAPAGERRGLGGFIVGEDAPRNRHEADYLGALPADKFDPRFIVLSAKDRAKLPIVDRFDSPVGTESGGFTYDAQPFGEWNEKREGYHSGQDLNGIGGENTDEGFPVFASGRGMVVYTGVPSRDWGHVVVIAHRLPNGDIIQTLYGHLKNPSVFLGQIVSRGKQIGQTGTADGLYWAHLHYEAMTSSFNEAGLPGYTKKETNRFDPTELNKKVGIEHLSSLKNDIFPALERLETERNKSSIQYQQIIATQKPSSNEVSESKP